MPRDGEEICLTELEIKILHAFDQHLFLTNSEIADALSQLANKLKK